jgi:hypothetical protein
VCSTDCAASRWTQLQSRKLFTYSVDEPDILNHANSVLALLETVLASKGLLDVFAVRLLIYDDSVLAVTDANSVVVVRFSVNTYATGNPILYSAVG